MFPRLCQVGPSPVLDIEGIHEWHPATPWCEHWWDFITPILALQVYFDGSANSSSGAAGFGVAGFVRVLDRWYFAGALAGEAPTTSGPYGAELALTF